MTAAFADQLVNGERLDAAGMAMRGIGRGDDEELAGWIDDGEGVPVGEARLVI